MHLLNPWLVALISLLIFWLFLALIHGVCGAIVGWRHGWPKRADVGGPDPDLDDDDVDPICLDK